MPQRFPGCVWYSSCLVMNSCLPLGSVIIWLHMSPHDVCAVRAVVCVVGGVHILWDTCICIHSWICGRFSWSAVHHNYMQDIFLPISSPPSRLLSPSASPVFLGYVVHVASQHIWCRNNPLSRQTGWGAIYGAKYQVLWLPRSIPPSIVAYVASHQRACLTVVSHSIHGKSQSKVINSGIIAWDYIP